MDTETLFVVCYTTGRNARRHARYRSDKEQTLCKRQVSNLYDGRSLSLDHVQCLSCRRFLPKPVDTG